MSEPAVVRREVIGGLEVRVAASRAAIARMAAAEAVEWIRSALSGGGAANVMFASGVSQLTFLDELVVQDGIDWTRVTGFHMDEYVGMPAESSASLGRYMRERIADRLPLRQFHYMIGDAQDPAAEAARYALLLRESPLDLCCLGIGENGHIAFNDPQVADFEDPEKVKVVDLEHASRVQQVTTGAFATVEGVPARAITVTIPVLLSARNVIAIAMGARKAEPVRAALRGPVSTSCPASALRRHPRATLYIDTDAASLL